MSRQLVSLSGGDGDHQNARGLSSLADSHHHHHHHRSEKQKQRYISRFAPKVRQELRRQKVCWSSMGLPSSGTTESFTTLSLPRARVFKQQSQHSILHHHNQHQGAESLEKKSKSVIPKARLPFLGPKSKPSIMTCSAAAAAASDENNSGDSAVQRGKVPEAGDECEWNSEEGEGACGNRIITRSALPNILNSCSWARAYYDMVRNTNPEEAMQLKGNEQHLPELRAKLSTVTSDQDLCDAFILQKLIEIRNKMEAKKLDENNSSSSSPEASNQLLPAASWHNGYLSQTTPRGEKDFIHENAVQCSRTPARVGPRKTGEDWGNGSSPPGGGFKKQQLGQVPEYINRRKEEIRQEKELLERFEAEESRRHSRALTEEERNEIIEGLSKNWEKLFLEFQNLPLFSASPRVLKRKGEIETKLRDLESDLRLISRHGRLFVSNSAAPPNFLWK